MKGSILDIIGVVLLITFFAVSILIGWTVLDQFETSTAFTGVGGNTTYTTQAKDAMGVFEWGILFILFGSMLFTIISAYKVDTHPALFIFGLIVFVIMIILVAIMSNTFHSIYGVAEFTTASNEFNEMVYVMDHLVEIMMVFGFILLIAVYGKLRNIGGNI